MASADAIGVIASASTDRDWYIDALEKSGVTVHRFSVTAFSSYAPSKTESHVLSCMNVNLSSYVGISANDVLVLSQRSAIVVAEAVPDDFYANLATTLAESGRHDVQIIAASVSQKFIFVAGPKHAVNAHLPLLQGPGIPVHYVPGDCSSAAKLRLVYDHLLGVHTVAAAEAMGLAAKAGLNTNQVYDIIVNAAGNSTAFETRAKKMLAGDWTPECPLNQTTNKLVCSCCLSCSILPSLPPTQKRPIR